MKTTVRNYYLKYIGLFLIGIVADIIVDVVQTYVPELLGTMVEIVSNNTNVSLADISDVVKNVIIIAFVLMAGRFVMRFSILSASGKIEANIRHDMFLKAERLSQRYYHENKIGTIMSWFSSDVEAVEEFTGWGTIMVVDAVFLSAVSFFKMIRLDIVLSIIAIIPMLALVIWGNRVEKIMSDKWEERQKQFDALYDFTQETFTGIRVIKPLLRKFRN